MQFVLLTEKKTGLDVTYNMSSVQRIENRSHGAALYYSGVRGPVRVTQSVSEIMKRVRRSR